MPSPVILYAEESLSLVPQWIRRSLGPSRTALLAELRAEPRSIEHLSRALRLTPSAVRSHLALLQQDGMVERTSIRRAVRGKPAYAYRLTRNAMVLLSSAYAPAAAHLAAAVHDRLGTYDAVAVFRAAGRSLAIRHRSGSARVRARLEDAATAITELGGRAQLVERSDAFIVTSDHCPLSALTSEHPAACHLLEALVGEIAGVHARQRCEHSGMSRCRFEVPRQETVSDASGDTGE